MCRSMADIRSKAAEIRRGKEKEVWQTSDLRPLRLGEEKKKKIERRKKETTGQKYNGPPIT